MPCASMGSEDGALSPRQQQMLEAARAASFKGVPVVQETAQGPPVAQVVPEAPVEPVKRRVWSKDRPKGKPKFTQGMPERYDDPDYFPPTYAMQKAAERKEKRRATPITGAEWATRCKLFMDGRGWERLVEMATNSQHKKQFAALELLAGYAFGRPEGTLKVEATSTNKVFVVKVDAVLMPESGEVPSLAPGVADDS